MDLRSKAKEVLDRIEKSDGLIITKEKILEKAFYEVEDIVRLQLKEFTCQKPLG